MIRILSLKMEFWSILRYAFASYMCASTVSIEPPEPPGALPPEQFQVPVTGLQKETKRVRSTQPARKCAHRAPKSPRASSEEPICPLGVDVFGRFPHGLPSSW